MGGTGNSGSGGRLRGLGEVNSLQGHSMCKSPEVGKDRLDVSEGPTAVCAPKCACFVCCNHHTRETLFNKTPCFLSPYSADSWQPRGCY